jgi:hypothetical protein
VNIGACPSSYLGLIGNTFHSKEIDRALELGKKYDPNRVVVESQKVLGLDPGWVARHLVFVCCKLLMAGLKY